MKVETLAKVQSVILIEGETGTGKTTLAKKIHQFSNRKNRPFIVVDLAAISESLIESELFGHCKGSFTGAMRDKIGFLSQIDGGTLFLDEIGEISPQLQKKLLRVLENKTYYPVGSTTAKKFEGTVIAATNVNLEKEVLKGRFREDLYFRLNIFKYKIPPIIENPALLSLAIDEIFLIKKQELGVSDLELCHDAKKKLMMHSWPGNYRELKNVIEYLIVGCEGEITEKDIPIFKPEEIPSGIHENYYEALAFFEKDFLSKKLLKYEGRINKTSREVGISKATLISKVKKYDINIRNIKSLVKKDQVVGF
jgi:DNA-binding NtrC family response regulator